jgi:hypothetical protein
VKSSWRVPIWTACNNVVDGKESFSYSVTVVGCVTNDSYSHVTLFVQRSLATDLQTLSMDFRKQQKGYLSRLQRQQEVHASLTTAVSSLIVSLKQLL